MRASRIWIVGLVTACAGVEPDIELPSRHRTSPALRSFNSCDELAAALRAHLKEEMRVRLLQQLDWYDEPANFAPEDSAGTPTAGAETSDTRQEGVDFSGTNNQETGVDEADFVKTDGYYIYVLNGGRLEIFAVPEFGELVATSTTQVEGSPTQLLVAGDKAVVFSAIYPWHLPAEHPLASQLGRSDVEGSSLWYRASTLSKLTVIDISERAAPKIAREIYLEGSYQTARKVEGSVRMVTYAWIDVLGLRYWVELPDAYYQLAWNDPERRRIYEQAVYQTIARNNAAIDATPLGDFVPQIYERRGAAVVAHPFTTGSCESFAIAEDGMSRGFTSILSLDLFGDTLSFDADHIVSNRSTVYASLTTLLVAEPAHEGWWYWRNESFEEATNIHRFDISAAGVTSYIGSGRVAGSVHNQFSLSERQGLVRVATTTGTQWWGWTEEPREPDNHLFVLGSSDEDGDGALDIVGSLSNIATGERIWSARFVGEKAYLVTFRNIDPLWTIDLSEPTQPRIIGELEVPGVSTYIHPLGDHLLTIGYGGTDAGLDWSTQVSLFDVSDFANPALDAALSLAPADGGEWSWAYSEANWEHKAFQYWAPRQLLAIPLSTYRYTYVGGCNADDAWCDYQYEYRSRLALIRVTPEAEGAALTPYGEIDHSEFFNSDPTRYWPWRDVRRSIFMGDYIYAISDRGVTVHRIEDLAFVTSQPLAGSLDEPYWAL